MRVIVDEAAWGDLHRIGSWIAKDSPEAARRELEKIEHVIKQLGRFPGLSRPGRTKGTLETVVAGSSYIVVFELWEKPAAVVVTGVVHGARNHER